MLPERQVRSQAAITAPPCSACKCSSRDQPPFRRLGRREFFSETGRLAAGAAFAASWLNTGSLPAAEQTRTRSDQEIACAMIGVGGRGTYLMEMAIKHGGAAVVAVCDVNEENRSRAAAAAGELQGRNVRQFGDFRKLLDDESVEALIVATPHHWHCPIAVRALDAGKHIYLEKPASHVFREGRLIADAARRSGKILHHGTQMRSSEVTAAAGKVLADGLLGEIKMTKAWGVEPRGHHPQPVADEEPPAGLDWDFWLGPAPKRPYNRLRHHRWNSYREYGNGEIGGDGIHDIDMARWGLAVDRHPTRITAHGSQIHLRGKSDYPDNMLVAYQYDDDDKVLIYENRNFAPYTMHGWDNGNIFYGTEGYMVFSRRGYFQTYLGADEEKGPGMRGSSGIEQHVRHFFDCIRTGQSNNADAQVAHLSCALVHLGETAYRTGRVLHFDPDNEQFRNDDEANRLLTKDYREPWTIPG